MTKSLSTCASQPRWKHIFLAFAHLATCSVADCERKHADHKRLCANAPFATFMHMLVNSVNGEFRNIFLRLQMHAKRKGKSCLEHGSSTALTVQGPTSFRTDLWNEVSYVRPVTSLKNHMQNLISSKKKEYEY